MAASLIAAGGVRINRARIEKPGHSLKLGDIVTVALHGTVRVLRVAAMAERRGQAADAVCLYEDLVSPEKMGRDAKKDGANSPDSC